MTTKTKLYSLLFVLCCLSGCGDAISENLFADTQYLLTVAGITVNLRSDDAQNLNTLHMIATQTGVTDLVDAYVAYRASTKRLAIAIYAVYAVQRGLGSRTAKFSSVPRREFY